MLLVHLGSPEKGQEFFASRWPEARAVSDQNEELYAAFGLKRGTLGQLLSPRVFLAGLKAARHGVGKPVGNPLLMSGWFLIDGNEIAWSHVHEHAGAPRRYEELLESYAATRESVA